MAAGFVLFPSDSTVPNGYQCLSAISARFDKECNRTFTRTADALHEFDTTDLEIPVPCYPIETVTKFELKENKTDGWTEQVPINSPNPIFRPFRLPLRFQLSAIQIFSPSSRTARRSRGRAKLCQSAQLFLDATGVRGYRRSNYNFGADMDPQVKTLVVAPLIGQTLNQYRIEELLGQGGMGVVYRARDLKLQRPVALKLLPAELTGDSERRKRFILEARAAARISHPAIAQIYDVDEHEGTFFIAMELVEGKTIDELIANRALDLLGAIDIGLQVAGGLAKAHAASILHRDIKPANVMQTPDGHVKILDFGLAKLLGPESSTLTLAGGGGGLSTLDQTQVGTMKGTPSYMSPEQVKGEPLDPRSDIFALGVMLFEMATGEVPFRRATALETMQAIAFAETPPMNLLRPNLPSGLRRIVSRCLQKRPEDRYPDAGSLVEELRVLRRETESGQIRSTSFQARIEEALDRLRHLKPAEYAWLAGVVLAVMSVIYVLTSKAGSLAPLLSFGFAALLIYRKIRNQPRKMSELFARKVAKIPEVRLIVCEQGKITVGVDRAVGQLYGRINAHLDKCNRKLFFGQPMSVMIRDDLSPVESRRLLAGPGVLYVRDDAIQAR